MLVGRVVFLICTPQVEAVVGAETLLHLVEKSATLRRLRTSTWSANLVKFFFFASFGLMFVQLLGVQHQSVPILKPWKPWMINWMIFASGDTQPENTSVLHFSPGGLPCSPWKPRKVVAAYPKHKAPNTGGTSEASEKPVPFRSKLYEKNKFWIYVW